MSTTTLYDLAEVFQDKHEAPQGYFSEIIIIFHVATKHDQRICDGRDDLAVGHAPS